MIRNGRLSPGTTFPLRISFLDEDGEPVDPDTVTLKLKSPRHVITTYVFGTDAELERESTGVYTINVVPNRAGRWSFRWETTGSGTSIVQEDSFIVMASPFVDDCYARDYR